jgi:hypothetical protein
MFSVGLSWPEGLEGTSGLRRKLFYISRLTHPSFTFTLKKVDYKFARFYMNLYWVTADFRKEWELKT